MSALNYGEEWERLSSEVEKEFLMITNSDRVTQALRLLKLWLHEELFRPQWESVMTHIRAGKYALLLDSFYQFIPFGTGGRRGRVGFGPNRINEATVALSVQGHCNYLNNKSSGKGPVFSVVIAYDVRIFKDIFSTYSFLKGDNYLLNLSSRKLAKIAAEIYAGCSIQSYMMQPQSDEGFLSTPELSFLIRQLQASGGINISASHNHPDDNGFKFFNTDGAQDIPPYDEELADYMNDIGKVTRLSFEEGLQKGLIKAIPHELHHKYIETNLHIKRTPPKNIGESTPPIVYTPLCGTGKTTVAEVLRAAGYTLIEYGPQAKFDGTFESIPLRLPNPEIPQAAWPAIQTADQHQAPIVLSTDPDADRLGILTKGKDGDWVYINGNEIGSLLAYYLILDQKRGPCRRGLVIKTLVTTGMIERIARKGNCLTVSDLLVGFKYIAHVLHLLEKDGHYQNIEAGPDDMVMATEESHGFLLTPEIRDKDAAGAALVLCDLVAKLEEEGRTLLDYLDEVASQCDNFGNDARGILMRGIKGADLLKKLMDSLRFSPPKILGSRKVIEIRDFLYDSIGKPEVNPESSEGKARNLLLFRFEGARVIIRPSGTEPKVKIYAEVEAPGSTRQKAKQQAGELATEMYRECLNYLGSEYRLSRTAEFIPDYIEMDLKKAFDTSFTPQFFSESSRLAGMDTNSLFEWFRTHLKEYGGGSDPLQSMLPALIELCLSSEGSSLIADKLKK